MKIKINFLIMIFFFNIIIGGINSESEVCGDIKIVEKTIKEIKSGGLLISFKEGIFDDLFQTYKKIELFLKQINKSNYESVYETITNENLSEAISATKAIEYYYRFAPSFQLISEETQVKIFAGLFFQIHALLNQKKQLDKLISNEQIGTLLFFLTAMGIQSVALGEFKKIVQLVNKNVMHLTNENLDDLVMQATLYEIFYILAEELVKEKIFNNAFNKITEDAIENKKTNIQNFKIKKNKMKKNK